MKGGPLNLTKVVLRHLPHTISQSALIDQIHTRFSDRYNWFCFRSGKNSLTCQSYSRAYIDFKQPGDVIEFADFFDGHVFVNEKGTQFKAVVEYAPSQRVPKQRSKKDGHEGTTGKDSEYLQFLEFISKPVENLPSAEIQLERKEAERAGAAKEAPVVTPLMDFIRQKRAAKGGPRRSLPNGKLMRRAGASSTSSSTMAKRGSEKRTTSTMYVLRDSGKSTNVKEKQTYVKRDNRQDSEHFGSVVLEEKRGTSDTGKKKILLLKGKEKEISHVKTDLTPQENSTSVKLAHGSGGTRQNQRHEVIRSILLNKDARQNQSEPNQTSSEDKDRRSPRSQNVLPLSNGFRDDKVHGYNLRGLVDKRSRNKDKPDRGVWTPLRRSDGPHASDDSLLSSASKSKQVLPDSVEGTCGEAKYDLLNESAVAFKPIGNGCGGHFSSENDSSANLIEGKPLKRGVSVGNGSHEKRVWVQKPSSGS